MVGRLQPLDPRPPREEAASGGANPVQPGTTPLSMRASLCIVGRIADPAVLLTDGSAPRVPVPSTQGRLFSAGSEGADLDKRVEDHIKKMATQIDLVKSGVLRAEHIPCPVMSMFTPVAPDMNVA